MRARTLPVLLLLLTVDSAGAAGDRLHAEPKDPRNFTWVVEGVLAVGGGGLRHSDVQTLDEMGFGAIANFRAEHKDPEGEIARLGMEHLYLPIDHAVNINVTQLEEFIAWAKQMEAEGRPIYAHCTHGWHRAAAFAAAWLMEREGLTFDEAAKRLIPARPGTMMRAPSALLAYEAKLEGRDGLVVMMHAERDRPEKNGTMPVTVEVLGAGKPVANARVKVWSEESGMRLSGTTDERGLFTFTYQAQDDAMDHLYARASAKGYVDGADDVELFSFLPADDARPIHVRAIPRDGRLEVTVTKDGHRVEARVLATSDDGWSHFDETGTGVTTLPLPREGRPITIRAERWGDLGDSVVVRPPRLHGEERVVEPPLFTLPPEHLLPKAFRPPELDAKTPPPASAVESEELALAPRLAAGAAALVAVAALWLLLRNRRARA